ncbi:MAG TPA: RecX family transcriptional regulator [bacterium]|nr:RecX family transcriptional regulator [bacterium]HQG46306.1 RecX family transcriptional regulator [bacterium]HQI47325.1 RecX family transcriptional regulator [bacterium]HQJ63400.1 RecX family transcriptional regulator [bacterium]
MAETHTVTAIEMQKKDASRISVFLDGEFAFGLHQDVLLECGIAKGDQLTAERVEAILALEERRRAKEKALRLLAVRSRSRKELTDRLKQALFSPAAVESALAEMERLGFLDDADFARMWGRNRTATRPTGAFMLRQELRQKGLNDAEIEQGLQAAFQDQSEAEVARALAVRRKKNLGAIPPEKAKKRLQDFLLRRGFGWEVVSALIDEWESL